jgi:hypothetical protein
MRRAIYDWQVSLSTPKAVLWDLAEHHILESKIVGQGAMEYAADCILQSSLPLLEKIVAEPLPFVLRPSRLSDYMGDAEYPEMMNYGFRAIRSSMDNGVLAAIGLAGLVLSFLVTLNHDTASAQENGFATARYRNLNCTVIPQQSVARLSWNVFHAN